MADNLVEEKKDSVQYAGFWIRALAMLLDSFILGLPIAVFVSFFFGWDWIEETMSQAHLLFMTIELVTTIAFWVNWQGRTPGKKIVGIRIVSFENYGPLNHTRAIIRYIGYTINFLIFGLGFLLIALRRDKRGLHDLIAGTAVIHER